MATCACPFSDCPNRAISAPQTRALAVRHALATEATPRGIWTLAQATAAMPAAELVPAIWIGVLLPANDLAAPAPIAARE